MKAVSACTAFLLASTVVAQSLGPERFEWQSPLPTLPAVRLDVLNGSVGLLQQTARAKGLQGRILWVDGTANIERTNDDSKVAALVSHARDAGFNTIVYDIKPISGHTMYPSKLAPKMLEWKGQKMPAEYDPLAAMVRECKAAGMPLLVSLNAFSEGHNLFQVGPGYGHPERQTVIYDAVPTITIGGATHRLGDKANAKVPPDGIGSFTDASKLPDPVDGAFCVSIGRDGTIQDGFEEGGKGREVPTIPTGGGVLFGIGRGAEFLRQHAVPGAFVVFDTVAEFKPISQRPDLQYPLMMNPLDPAVQNHALAIIDEVLDNYDVGGVLYDDRLRYAGLYADFSESTRQAFEKRVGKMLHWPNDVLKFTVRGPSLARGVLPGPYNQAWLTFRAEVMAQWIRKVGAKVRQAKPNAKFGIYAGSWYGEYPAYGSNFGAADLDAGFGFLSRSYARTGFAADLDLLITGCYYATPTIIDAMAAGGEIGQTVEAAGILSNRVADDDTWTMAGIMLSQYKGKPELLERALQAACGSTQGVMVFDLSHEIEPFWSVFRKAFARPAMAPHESGLLAQLRAQKRSLRKSGYRPPVVPIFAGASGAGF